MPTAILLSLSLVLAPAPALAEHSLTPLTTLVSPTSPPAASRALPCKTSISTEPAPVVQDSWIARLKSSWLGIVLVLLLLGSAVLLLRYMAQRREPFLTQRPLLTAREQKMYWRIQEALAGQYVILAQVAFSQMVQAKGGTAKERFALFARVRQKVADYVICRSDFSIVAVIELDDSSHDHKLDKDAERDACLREAGIPTLRWRSLPSAAEIAKQVKALD
ncbi:DUF2726 domain-containing protein [Chitinimonas lacunae]|uniref:DUF2726 domain-containing protein n=1 Tax=Chitinimonas lacunae TaxID=1963018 RepID=A0ABV8MMV7_9NEIS